MLTLNAVELNIREHPGESAFSMDRVPASNYERFNTEIAEPSKVVRELPMGTGEPTDLSIDSILAGPEGYAAYTKREQDWFAKRQELLSTL